MGTKFDPALPYSEVQGDSMAGFYQNGRYYDSDHNELSAEDAGKPSGSGSFTNQVKKGVDEEVARLNAEKPLTLIDETNPSTNSGANIKAARKRAANKKAAGKTTQPVTHPDITSGDSAAAAPVGETAELAARRAELQGLHVSVIKKLVVAADLTPATGTGAKAANIDLLLKNTE